MSTGAIAGSEPPGIEVALVSGLSGAGRSTAAKVLEDLGWFVVDNLPPELIATMVDLGARARGEITRIAVVMDVRSRAFTADLGAVIKDLDARGYKPRLLFLEASDAVLVRRFEQVRRSHPLQGDGRLIDGIAAERELLAPAAGERRPRRRHVHGRGAAAARHPGARVRHRGRAGHPRHACCRSATSTACRWTPTSWWTSGSCPTRTGSRSCASYTGRDEPVRDYVLTQDGAEEFISRYLELLRLVGAGYRREGKRYLTVAVGCTGGKHRSVAISEELARRLAGSDGVTVNVAHRDLGRE